MGQPKSRGANLTPPPPSITKQRPGPLRVLPHTFRSVAPAPTHRPLRWPSQITATVDGRVPKGTAMTLTGATHRPSAGEWQRVLLNPAHMVFLFSGVGRLAGAVGLEQIAGLNVSHIRCGLLLDRGMNEAGSRRQSKQDLAVVEHKRILERPDRVANMFSCRGMGSMVINLYCNQVRRGVVWCGLVWHGAVQWGGVAWGGVWCGVVWRGAATDRQWPGCLVHGKMQNEWALIFDSKI